LKQQTVKGKKQNERPHPDVSRALPLLTPGVRSVVIASLPYEVFRVSFFSLISVCRFQFVYFPLTTP